MLDGLALPAIHMLRVAPKTPIRHAILGMLSSDSSTKVLRSLTSARLSDSPKTVVSFTPLWSLRPGISLIDEASRVPNSNLRIHSKICAVPAGEKSYSQCSMRRSRKLSPARNVVHAPLGSEDMSLVPLVLYSLNMKDLRGY